MYEGIIVMLSQVEHVQFIHFSLVMHLVSSSPVGSC